MDDLTAKLQEILGSEEGQQQLQSMAEMLGLGGGESGGAQTADGTDRDDSQSADNAGGGLDLSSLAGMLGGSGGGGFDLSALSGLLGGGAGPGGENDSAAGGFDLSKIDVGMIMKLQQMMSSFNREDDNTRLLHALKPHLRKERQQKADEAIRLMQLMEMLPMLKESGLFGGDAGGGKK